MKFLWREVRLLSETKQEEQVDIQGKGVKSTLNSLTLTKPKEECLQIREGFYLHESLGNEQAMHTSLSLLRRKPPTLQPLQG